MCALQVKTWNWRQGSGKARRAIPAQLFNRLLADVIDDDYGNRTLLLYQFQPELPFERLKERDAARIGGFRNRACSPLLELGGCCPCSVFLAVQPMQEVPSTLKSGGNRTTGRSTVRSAHPAQVFRQLGHGDIFATDHRSHVRSGFWRGRVGLAAGTLGFFRLRHL